MMITKRRLLILLACLTLLETASVSAQTTTVTDPDHSRVAWDSDDDRVVSFTVAWDAGAPTSFGIIALGSPVVGVRSFGITLPSGIADGTHTVFVVACGSGALGCTSPVPFTFTVARGGVTPPVCPGDPNCPTTPPPGGLHSPIRIRIETTTAAATTTSAPLRAVTATSVPATGQANIKVGVRPKDALPAMPAGASGTVAYIGANDVDRFSICLQDVMFAWHCVKGPALIQFLQPSNPAQQKAIHEQ